MNPKPSRVIVLLAAFVLLGFVAMRRAGLSDSVLADLKMDSATATAPEPDATPVLVELFTSEGCSSCPPADALLSRLGRTQPVHGADIIMLEEHVDYWDGLGWKDPFSSEAATMRQREYGSALGGQEIYTPEMVVDGSMSFVGSSDMEALRAIRLSSKAHKPAVQLAWGADDTLKIDVSPIASSAHKDDLQLFLAVSESMLHTDVKHGENAGRGLEHNGVVRQLSLVTKINSPSSGISSTATVHPAREWKRENLRAVVFVQDRNSRHILAVAAIPFPKV